MNCTKQYQKSSTRSIRKHIVQCALSHGIELTPEVIKHYQRIGLQEPLPSVSHHHETNVQFIANNNQNNNQNNPAILLK